MEQNFINSNTRGEKNKKKKKFNFSQKKENTLQSISDVEHFLRDFKRRTNYIKLYKIMK